MGQCVFYVVKAPVGWSVVFNGARIGGVYGTKEAALEAASIAASFSIRDGNGVLINVPASAEVKDTEPWPSEWNNFLK